MPPCPCTAVSAWLLGPCSLLACLGLVGCTTMPTTGNGQEVTPAAVELVPPTPPIYDMVSLPGATVHVVKVPDPVNYPVRVAMAEELMPVDEVVATTVDCAAEGCVIAAINAGFFDPNNGLTTSYVVMEGALVADPRDNARLIDNPDLAPYMEQILNRSEFRRYDCGGVPEYAIVAHATPIPEDCTLADAVGAGPQLLPQNTSITEAFVDDTVSPRRDALGSRSANARSAIGITDDGSIILAMVAQVPGVSPSGLNFADLADFMAQQGATQVLNLDGGSSSTLVYRDTIYHGRLDSQGVPVRRPVKSIIWVGD
jgi:hypothetical protein